MRRALSGWLVRFALVVGLVSAGLAFASSSTVAAQTSTDVQVRDQLISFQEALLNTYRCLFRVDLQVVPGGCSGTAPALPAKGPAPFTGTPTANDVAIRDQLIANQEALLNVYRCRFNVDTQIVPGGCGEQVDPPSLDDVEVWGVVPWDADFLAGWNAIEAFIDNCSWNQSTRMCAHPADTQTVYRMWGQLFECQVDAFTGNCVGYSVSDQAVWNAIFACPEDWSISYDPRVCHHPEHPSYRDWNYPL